ncbi:MAG: biopolymer transporter ExbD [Akkermansiaceae bacterium]|nr:biopolymer transporter ExbD [Akkermansiaceae bacterium]MCP5551680.1 biopolymer transporter ExbD [Akkermansiaceae bacterium]
MQRRRGIDSSEVSFQITPMIDMTFLLLIFFMVTTKLTDQQVNVPVKLPVAVSAVPPGKIERDIVNIDGEGRYYIGDRPASKAELKVHLEERFRDFPPLQVYLRADENTPGKTIREVIKMAGEAGALDVIVATFQK